MKFQLFHLRTSISVPTSILCLGSKAKWKELFHSVKSQHAVHILADVWLKWRSSFWKQKCYIFLGTAMSDRNRKSYKASIAARQRSSKDKLHDCHHPTFGFHLHLLHTWGTFDICSVWKYWIDGKFLTNHTCLFQWLLFLSFAMNVLNIILLLLLGRCPYLFEGLPHSLEIVTHIMIPEVSRWGYEIFLEHLPL